MLEPSSTTPQRQSRSVYLLRQASHADIEPIRDLTRRVYPFIDPYDAEMLLEQQRRFQEGQFVVEHKREQTLVGFAASFILKWDEKAAHATWWQITGEGTFRTHDPKHGRTLYGAEIMVDPGRRGQGVGKLLYEARESLTRRLGLGSIKAGARLRDYNRVAKRMTPEDYVKAVILGKLTDRTLTFQLRRGFHVLDVVPNYLYLDPESLGHAAIIEWVNADAATEQDFEEFRRSRFYEVHNSAVKSSLSS